MIVVEGIDGAGNEVEALIPQTDIQIVLTKVKKSPGHRAIGFQTRETESGEQEQGAE